MANWRVTNETFGYRKGSLHAGLLTFREIVCSRRQCPPPDRKGMKGLSSILPVFAIAAIPAGAASASPIIVTPAGLNPAD
jgi:hypothetical protein